MSTIIYDLTDVFADKFIERNSRTKDQMIQAARSGRQNIAEGSMASTTSRESEIKLTNVAIASLEELLLDYEDYLRQHKLHQWDKTNPRALKLRSFLKTDSFMTAPMFYIQKLNAEEYCNLCITLIHQTSYILGKLLIAQQEQFVEHGGIREQMHKARLDYRKTSQGTWKCSIWNSCTTCPNKLTCPKKPLGDG